MTRLTLGLAALAAGFFIPVTPAAAQTKDGVLGELLADVEMVEKKVIGLANALPQSAWEWRPAAGVRSTSEVFLHIAADNYFLPAILDIPAPAETGVTKEYKTAEAFEKKTMTREAAIAELQKSFAFLKTSISGTAEAKLNTSLKVFGRDSTTRGMWISTVTHLHEHLGQLIVHARSNKITPPWSK